MAKISDNVIEEIKRRISLEDVVSRYLNLTKKGDRYWGLCPFHDEKTPSFTVHAEKGFFHCFGCNKSGSIFDFIMEMEHLTFVESVERLAKEAGVTLTQESESDRKRRSEVESLRLLYDRIAASFHYILLHSDSARHAREYIQKRHVSKEMQERYLLGYAPDDPFWLYSFLISKEYSPQLLEQSGLFTKKNKEYPLFRNRLMFPIRNAQGQVVAFGGRDLSFSSNAKYINTPETALYKKREMLYGLYESLSEIKKEGKAVLCEGNFDVIALAQSGVVGAVAPLGTAFTVDQGKLLKRYCDHLTFLFDDDEAGQRALAKSALIAEQQGFENSVIVLDDAKDPSEMLSQKGEKELFTATERRKSLFHHLVHSAINRYDSSQATGKLQIFTELRPFLEATESEIVRQSYFRDLASYLQVDVSVLLYDYQQQQKPVHSIHKGEDEKRRFTHIRKVKQSTDLYMMLTLINNRSLFSSYRNRIRIEHMVDEQAIELFTILEDVLRENPTISDELLLHYISDVDVRELVAKSFQMPEFTLEAERTLNDALRNIEVRELEKVRKRVEQLLSIAEKEGGKQLEVTDLLFEKKTLDEKIATLKGG
ncbi:MAG: DNA primase [Sphaerochaetaceae bacterium]